MSDLFTMDMALASDADPAWVLTDDGYDPLRECSRESRFAISNGFLGVRGARATNRKARLNISPRTYVAGLFDSVGPEQPFERRIAAADWLQIRVLLSDGASKRCLGTVSAHQRSLELQRGALLTSCHVSVAGGGGVDLRMVRLVSLADRAIGLQLIRFDVVGHDVDIMFEASFGGMDFGLEPECLEQELAVWRTRSSGKELAIAASALLRIDGVVVAPEKVGPLKWSWHWRAQPGQIACFSRLVAIGRDDENGDHPGAAMSAKLANVGRLGWQSVISSHQAAWARRWHLSDVKIDGDVDAQKALRFAVYHLNGAADPSDPRISIGARALTGEDYFGHVFWDTEIFLLPFYTLTWPDAARSLLMYRFHTLEPARAKARRLGWKGALYAWGVGLDRDETTPEHAIGPDRQIVDILCGTQEIHISADVAYAVWHYWLATGDEAFLLDAGAEIVLETGRFWASRAVAEKDGYRHIRGVIGPDEYHETIDDNAFTNVMARWNIRCAIDVAALLRHRWPHRWAALADRLDLHDAELKAWQDAVAHLYDGLDQKTGLFEQFESYFKLDPIDLAQFSGRSVPMDVVLGRDETRRSQVIKQADVVALLGLLPEEFTGGMARDNFRYYEARCSHGSSLSRVMHGVVAARLGESEAAMNYFRDTSKIDLSETHVAIDGGIHIAALGGIWMIAVLGFAGLSIGRQGLALDPHLPPAWHCMTFRVQWQGRTLCIRIDQAKAGLEATLEAGARMTLSVCGQQHELHPDCILYARIGAAAGLFG